MKIPLTKYGLPQVVIYPAAVLAFMVVLWFGAHPTTPVWLVHYVEIALGVVFIWALSFFRDPERVVPQDKDILLAPADGKITDIETVDEPGFIGGKAIRVGIFLSIFDVHINRSPCKARVEKITYREGQYLDARKLESGRLNESNDLWLTRIEPSAFGPLRLRSEASETSPAAMRRGGPFDKLIVRQISGAIARRIVCRTAAGAELLMGERFGMIKFGSRTELYVPVHENVKCLVNIGDKVKAGLTPIIRYI